jgi:hypothetical protein
MHPRLLVFHVLKHIGNYHGNPAHLIHLFNSGLREDGSVDQMFL